MTTIDKKNKPKIFTESDQILSDLQQELSTLKSRMSSIEAEQEKNRYLVEKLSFQEELANESIRGHKEEIKLKKESFRVIANVMHQLRSPVSQVVSNLSSVIADIDDQDTQNTLKDCVTTASTVLNSFDDVEDFCLSASHGLPPKHKAVVIRDYFREIVSQLQHSNTFAGSALRLLVDKQVPEKTILNCSALQTVLEGLFSELRNASNEMRAVITIGSEKKDRKYGIETEDISISIDCDEPTTIEWQDSWVDSIKRNHATLLNAGLNLLKMRDLTRKSGGNLEINSRDNKIKGFKLLFPLTY